MLIYGIIDIVRAILAYYLAKYQYFTMILGLLDTHHKIHILHGIELKMAECVIW